MPVRPPSALLALALLLAGCEAPQSPCGPSSAKVVNVVDGDTIDLEDGTRVRLLLVDTPETTKGKDDCWGQQAAAYTRGLVEGQTVQLAYDDASCKDRYGRTLAWVTKGDVELNAELVKQGYACTLYVAPAGEARREDFDTWESEARTARTGMWGACSDIPCSE